MYQFDDERLRLDIGASIDIYEWGDTTNAQRFSVGADFMTWTRLRSETNFKFPVETIDYWFGVNFKGEIDGWQGRVRLAHISSHLVDGLADQSGTLSPAPFVYSREFIELIASRNFGVLRPYVGATLMWATQPDDPNPVIPQAGVDLRWWIGPQFQVRGGYDLRLVGINGTYAAANAAQLGVFFEAWNGRGVMLSLYGYSGRSMHGMFYQGYDAYGALRSPRYFYNRG